MATTQSCDGVEIIAGLRVLTSNVRWGTVVKQNDGTIVDDEGWFYVLEDGASTPTGLNGERVICKTGMALTHPDPKAQ